MKTLKLLFIPLVIILLFVGCSSESENNDTIDTSDYLYFVSGKINGESFFYGQRMDATVLDYQIVYSLPLEAATCAFSADQGQDYKINYSSSVYPNFDNENSQPALGLDFNRFYRCADSQSSTEVFNDLFSIGTYDFADNNDPAGTMRQVGVTYSPIADGDVYYESYGGAQSSSQFRITATEENNDFLLGNLINQRQIIDGEFSATLYNTNDNSDVIEITEGEFRIYLSK